MYRVDVYLRVRRAVMVEGMSIREAARTFGLHRDTVRKMLAYSVPPGYRRQTPPLRHQRYFRRAIAPVRWTVTQALSPGGCSCYWRSHGAQPATVTAGVEPDARLVDWPGH